MYIHGYVAPGFEKVREEAIGFAGTGGSFAFTDPKYQLGFAYFMNKMDFYGINDPRETSLREAVHNCIDSLE